MQTDQHKRTRIDRIIGEVIRQRRDGAPVEYVAVARRYPDLMPELGQRLKRLQAVECAALQARTDPEEKAGAIADPHQAYLRQAFRDYDALERIDYGGQGIVYTALHRPTKRAVAIKILLEGALASSQQRRRFAREVELIARLRHPNIVTVYDSGEIEGRPFLVMEYIDGLPIADHVEVYNLPVRSIVELFLTVCRAVNVAHQHGVIHRDLKPGNILVDDEGQPHLLDFGLAKELTSEPDVSAVSLTGQVVGTLPYLSPEQARGDAPVDVRSDIYALGVILYECLVGERPYPVDGDRLSALANIMSRAPLGLRKALALRPDAERAVRRGDVSDDLEKIVTKALAKEPERRYQSADALADDLARYLAGEAVHAKSASRMYVLRKTVRRFRYTVAAAAICVVVLVAALIGVTVAWSRAERVAQIAMAGLDLGSLLKLGSVERDAGRIDQAIAMFEKVVETGKAIRSDDPVIQRQMVNAHHRLAELFFATKRPDRAGPHANEAIQIAETQAARYPDDLEWRSQLGAAQVLRGRLAFSRESYEEALASFTEAAGVQESLIGADVDNPSLQADLAYTLGWQGRSARKLNRLDESGSFYHRSLGIYRQLAERDPQNTSRGVDLTRAECKMAVWHLAHKSAQHDVEAGPWLDSATARIEALQNRPESRDRQWDIDTLREEIAANRQLIARRELGRNEDEH